MTALHAWTVLIGIPAHLPTGPQKGQWSRLCCRLLIAAVVAAAAQQLNSR